MTPDSWIPFKPRGAYHPVVRRAAVCLVLLACSERSAAIPDAAPRDAGTDACPTERCGGFDARPADAPAPDARAADAAVADGPGPDARGPDAPRPDAAAPVELPPCAGDLAALFSRAGIDPPAAGSGDYAEPGAVRLAGFDAALGALVGGDVAGAARLAPDAGYDLCRARADVLVLLPRMRGEARIAYRPATARPLVVEAPHPFYDSGTLEESLVFFETLEARALVASGTHRCASDTPSGCDGRTSACEMTDRPYVVSDMAHTELSFFHRAHVALAERHTDHVVVSVHGEGGDGGSISDGTSGATTADSRVARLQVALRAAFPGLPITACNAWPGAPAIEERLCGSTNVQGRHVNGVADACHDAAARASGRFIHLEQSRTLRMAPAEVAAAFADIVP